MLDSPEAGVPRVDEVDPGPTFESARVVAPDGFADPVTRMVVASDGSTTALLAALLGAPLSIRVLRQEVAGQAPRYVRTGLSATVADSLVSRLSALISPAGHVVSVNHVWISRDCPDTCALLSGTHRSIGAVLAANGIAINRRQRSVRVSRWIGLAGKPAAVRDYVLDCQGNPTAYFVEHFNPTFVPAGLRSHQAWP